MITLEDIRKRKELDKIEDELYSYPMNELWESFQGNPDNI